MARKGRTKAGPGPTLMSPIVSSSSSNRSGVCVRNASPTGVSLITTVGGWLNSGTVPAISVTTQFTGAKKLFVILNRHSNQSQFSLRQFQRFVDYQPEYGRRVGAGQQFGCDVAGGFDPCSPRRGLFVQSGVLNGDPGGGG